MNLPNKLTVLRVILVPFFVFFLLGADWIGSFSPYIALIIFIVASLTDMLDGKIARKYNLITNFGKFMDPLADKLLVCSALICFVDMHRITIIFMIPNFGGAAVHMIEQIMIYLSLALTVISLIDYLIHNKSVLAGKM